MKKIIEIRPDFVVCEMSNGSIKKINIEDLMEKHQHFKGIEKLKNPDDFINAKIGIMGEIFWEKIIELNGEFWDYDISPEFILELGEDMKMA